MLADLRVAADRRRELLAAAEDRPDRPAGAHGGHDGDGLVRMEALLVAERSADERLHDPHLRLGQPEDPGGMVAHDVGLLGRRPQRDPSLDRIPRRDRAVGLHRHRVRLARGEAALEHEIGVGESGFDIAGPGHLAPAHVAVDARIGLVVDERCPVGHGPLGIEDGGQLVIVDRHQAGSLGRQLGRLGNHRGNWLLHMADLVLGQDRHVEDQARREPRPVGNIRRHDHVEHAVDRPGAEASTETMRAWAYWLRTKWTWARSTKGRSAT